MCVYEHVTHHHPALRVQCLLVLLVCAAIAERKTQLITAAAAAQSHSDFVLVAVTDFA